MTATPSIELPAWMAEQLSQASPGHTPRLTLVGPVLRLA